MHVQVVLFITSIRMCFEGVHQAWNSKPDFWNSNISTELSSHLFFIYHFFKECSAVMFYTYYPFNLWCMSYFKNQLWNSFDHVFQMPNFTLFQWRHCYPALVFQYTSDFFPLLTGGLIFGTAIYVATGKTQMLPLLSNISFYNTSFNVFFNNITYCFSS